MFTWIDGRKFSNSKTLLTFNLSSKHLNPFIKIGFEPNSFTQLPVIKEEEGFLSDDEVELTQEFLQSPLLKNSYAGQSSSYVTNSNKYLKSLGKNQNVKLVTKLPSLVNINCLMNTEVKQTPAIWNTSFGRNFINAKNNEENLDSTSDIKSVSFNYAKNGKNEFGNYLFPKPTSKRKYTQQQSIRHDGRDKTDVRQFKTKMRKMRKTKKVKKNNQNFLKKGPVQEKNSPETDSELLLSENFQETLSKKSLKENETVSSLSKKQKVLTNCVQSILDCYSTEMTCEYCSEKLPDIKKINAHKMQHEAEKEICLLCDKVFYDSKKFTQHLLTHESVDQFSCKKCKKYFPNLKKYEQHCKNSHLILPCNISEKNSHDSELTKELLLKFEGKQCNLKFDSKKAQKDHKKHPTKKNVDNAYILGYKNI